MGLKRDDGFVRNGSFSAQGDLMNPRCSNCKVATRASSLDRRPTKYRHGVRSRTRYFESYSTKAGLEWIAGAGVGIATRGLVRRIPH